MARAADGGRRVDVLITLAAVLGALACGAAFGHGTGLGTAVTLGLALAVLALVRPVTVGIFALCASFAVQRLGGSASDPGSSGGITYADLALAGATLVAVFVMVQRRDAALRRIGPVLLALGAYLACLLPSVVLNYTQRGLLEWGHRVVLIGGAVLVGLWIAVEQAHRVALRCLLVVSLVVAVATVFESARHGFGQGQPFGLNKNFVGALLAAVIVVVLLLRRTIDLDLPAQALSAIVLAAGLVASHSRGGMLAAVFGLVVAVVLGARRHGRGTMLLTGAVTIALGVVAGISIHRQFGVTALDFNNGSLGVRLDVERATRQIWRTSPIDGVGLRYYTLGTFGPYAQPANNVIDNELAESGVIGLVGFVIMQAGLFWLGIRRRADPVAAVGVGVVAGLLLHGMVDIYWSAGATSLPFLILGLGLGPSAGESRAAEVDGRRSAGAVQDGVDPGEDPRPAVLADRGSRRRAEP